LDVRCDLDVDLDVPLAAVEALSAATGEALCNVAAHAGVRAAMLTARRSQSGGVTVTVSDDGIGFDPARVGPASTGLRNSIRTRLSDAGGHAEVISAPGQGTSVVLTWDPALPGSAPAADPLAWARRMAPSAVDPRGLHAAVSSQRLGISVPALAGHALASRRGGVVRRHAGHGHLVCAVLEPGADDSLGRGGPDRGEHGLRGCGRAGGDSRTTDAFAYWAAGVRGTGIAAVYFIRGPISGLTALALDAGRFQDR